jgi:hypothetical protein
LFFDVQAFCLTELRNQAAFLYEDVHLLAQCYHWTEADILALPRHRRAHYAEFARSTGRTNRSTDRATARGIS